MIPKDVVQEIQERKLNERKSNRKEWKSNKDMYWTVGGGYNGRFEKKMKKIADSLKIEQRVIRRMKSKLM